MDGVDGNSHFFPRLTSSETIQPLLMFMNFYENNAIFSNKNTAPQLPVKSPAQWKLFTSTSALIADSGGRRTQTMNLSKSRDTQSKILLHPRN